MADDTDQSFDPDRVLQRLARHGVEYLLVGGLAARAHGARRQTDAGPLDLLVELRDRQGGRHNYAELSSRAVGYDVGDLTVRLASLDDIVASKEFADRDKDRDALPELNELLRHHQAD